MLGKELFLRRSLQVLDIILLVWYRLQLFLPMLWMTDCISHGVFGFSGVKNILCIVHSSSGKLDKVLTEDLNFKDEGKSQ
jgi:hypothetical protein